MRREVASDHGSLDAQPHRAVRAPRDRAAEGVRLWAQEAGIRLILADDHGSRSMAVDTYAGWIDGVDLLLGPYASGLVRAVAPARPRCRADPLEPRRFG